MSPELEDVLARKFPGIFRDIRGDIEKTCMAWGIECGDGWFLILWRLCRDIEGFGDVVATQVKEKYGGLRFYTHGGTHVDDRIAQAEAESMQTCENCGRPGRVLNDRGWFVCACDECVRVR